MEKKKYLVNVHYDAVVSVEVIASDERQALELAEEKASCISLNTAEVVETKSCVADVTDITERKFSVYLIDWDIDDDDMTPEEIAEVKSGLPDEVTITIPDSEFIDPDDSVELEDYISDKLSDEYGFCVNGYNYSEIQ